MRPKEAGQTGCSRSEPRALRRRTFRRRRPFGRSGSSRERSCAPGPCCEASVETGPAREQLCAWRRLPGRKASACRPGGGRRDALCSVVAQLRVVRPGDPLDGRPQAPLSPLSWCSLNSGLKRLLCSEAVGRTEGPCLQTLAQCPHLVLSSLWPSGPSSHQHRRLQSPVSVSHSQTCVCTDVHTHCLELCPQDCVGGPSSRAAIVKAWLQT